MPIRSEPGWRRPALIVSCDRFNRSGIRTVVVAAVTSSMRHAEAPGNVELRAGSAGLPRLSLVNVSVLSAIDRSRLLERSGAVTADVMTDVDDGLRLMLAL